MDLLESSPRFGSLIGHDVFGKPLHTSLDRAVTLRLSLERADLKADDSKKISSPGARLGFTAKDFAGRYCSFQYLPAAPILQP
jgi:hypothetical protein